MENYGQPENVCKWKFPATTQSSTCHFLHFRQTNLNSEQDLEWQCDRPCAWDQLRLPLDVPQGLHALLNAGPYHSCLMWPPFTTNVAVQYHTTQKRCLTPITSFAKALSLLLLMTSVHLQMVLTGQSANFVKRNLHLFLTDKDMRKRCIMEREYSVHIVLPPFLEKNPEVDTTTLRTTLLPLNVKPVSNLSRIREICYITRKQNIVFSQNSNVGSVRYLIVSTMTSKDTGRQYNTQENKSSGDFNAKLAMPSLQERTI